MPMTVAAVTVFCAALSLTGEVGRPAFGQPYLVEDGRARAEIVLGVKPGRVAKLAARELQLHVEKIAGATLAIVSEPSGKAPVKIYVGKNACADRLDLST